MKKPVCLRSVWAVVFIALFFSCSTSVDINNEEAVLKDIQGAWIGYQHIGKVYCHYKLTVANNLFEGWKQNSESKDEPTWAKVPDEKGFISLSSLINDPGKDLRYRKFALTCAGRCCGDRSFLVKTLAELIMYQEGKGLILDGTEKMIKK